MAVDGGKPSASYPDLLIPREKLSLPTKQQAGENTYGFVLKGKIITLSMIALLPSNEFICRTCERKWILMGKQILKRWD
jgi:hypothetical protein